MQKIKKNLLSKKPCWLEQLSSELSEPWQLVFLRHYLLFLHWFLLFTLWQQISSTKTFSCKYTRANWTGATFIAKVKGGLGMGLIRWRECKGSCFKRQLCCIISLLGFGKKKQLTTTTKKILNENSKRN